jgi:hypothetical protein
VWPGQGFSDRLDRLDFGHVVLDEAFDSALQGDRGRWATGAGALHRQIQRALLVPGRRCLRRPGRPPGGPACRSTRGSVRSSRRLGVLLEIRLVVDVDAGGGAGFEQRRAGDEMVEQASTTIGSRSVQDTPGAAVTETKSLPKNTPSTISVSNSASASGDASADSRSGKSRVPESITTSPARNLRVVGLGVCSVRISMGAMWPRRTGASSDGCSTEVATGAYQPRRVPNGCAWQTSPLDCRSEEAPAASSETVRSLLVQPRLSLKRL